MTTDKGAPAWIWVSFGCVVAVFFAAIFAVVVFVFGAQKAREFEAGLSDPQVREEKVLGVLGAESVPEGYYPMLGVSLPFVFDMALLTSEPPGPAGEMPEDLGERTFIYFKMLGRATQEEELYDFFEGKTNDPTVLQRQRIRLDLGERLDRGSIERDDANILWVAHEGNFRFGRRATRQGIASLILFQCPGQRRLRMGIWTGPSAPASVEGGTPDLQGTTGDGLAIEGLVQGFRPCGLAESVEKPAVN